MNDTCCFSGYRPEKMPLPGAFGAAIPDALSVPLREALRAAVRAGCTRFWTGMSRGFDLWAAQAVLLLRQEAPVKLGCAIPFEGQDRGWDASWRALYAQVRRCADTEAVLAPAYAPDCFAARNRFMVERASRLICYYDGRPGGTAQTVRLARRRGLIIDNLADGQLRLDLRG